MTAFWLSDAPVILFFIACIAYSLYIFGGES